MTPLRKLLAAALVAVGSFAPAAPAQSSPAPSDVDLARDLAVRGIALHRAGQHREAIRMLEQAEARFHAPTHLYYIGASREALGDLLGAHEVYRALAAEELPNYAPDAFQKARAAGLDALRRVETSVATLEVRVETMPEGGVVSLDGAALDASKLSRPVAVQPGEHRLVLGAPGLTPVERTVRAVIGKNEIVVFEATVPRGSGSPRADAGPVTVRAGAPVATEDDTALVPPAIAAFSVGGTALVAGAVTGVMALVRGREITDHCDGARCPLEYADDAEEVRKLGIASTVAFGAAGAGMVTGIVLVAVDGARAGGPPESGLAVGPGVVSLRGRF